MLLISLNIIGVEGNTVFIYMFYIGIGVYRSLPNK